MAVTDAPRTDAEVVEASQDHNKLSAWSGVIATVTYLLIGLLAVGMVTMLVMYRNEEGIVDARRESFDTVFKALKDKKKATERIAALEKVWGEINGGPAHPYVMTLLAREHWDLSVREERAPAARADSREKAAKIYTLLFESYGDSKAYGPVALEGAALCHEMNGDYDKAIEFLKKGLSQYEGHFLYPTLNYHLARILYIRAAKAGTAGDPENADIAEARRLVTTSLTSTEDSQFDFITWRSQAKFLRSLVEKPGPGMSIEIPPAPATPAEDETGDANEGEETGEAPAAEERAEDKPDDKTEEKKKETAAEKNDEAKKEEAPKTDEVKKEPAKKAE